MSAATLPSLRPRTPAVPLLWHQIRYEQLSFWRNTQNAVFTFAFPVVFMTVLGLLMRGGTASSYFYGRTPVAYYMPTIAALSVTRFGVQIVPFTWSQTTLKDRRAGDAVNLEADVIGKYVARSIELRAPQEREPAEFSRGPARSTR